MAKRSADGLYKRGSFWWGWRRSIPGGPVARASTKCRDRKAARIVKAEWERQSADPIHYASNQTTLRDGIDMFIADSKRRGLAAPTLEMYKSKCGHIARVLDDTRPLRSVVAITWDGYIATREQEGASSHSIKKELIRGLGVLRAAKRRGLYPHDLSTIMPSYSARYVPRTRALTMDELIKLGRELRADRLAHVAFVVATGCRLKESYRATEAHLLPEGFVFVDGTKTKRARRTIPIAPPLRNFLEFAVRNAPGASEATALLGVPPLNNSEETALGNLGSRNAVASGAPLFPLWHSARRDILAACRRAEIAPCTWNDLRRTNATLLAEAGVGSDTGARLLGHVDGRMWEQVYSQPKPKALQRALDAAFEDGTPTSQPDLVPRELPAKKAESATGTPSLRSRRSTVRTRGGAREKPELPRARADSSSAEPASLAGVPYTDDTDVGRGREDLRCDNPSSRPGANEPAFLTEASARPYDVRCGTDLLDTVRTSPATARKGTTVSVEPGSAASSKGRPFTELGKDQHASTYSWGDDGTWPARSLPLDLTQVTHAALEASFQLYRRGAR